MYVTTQFLKPREDMEMPCPLKMAKELAARIR